MNDNLPVDTNTLGFDPTKHYLGKLCKRNHEYKNTAQSVRFLNNRCCLVCNKEHQKKYRQNNSEKFKEIQRKYSQTEKSKKMKRKYRQANLEKQKEYQKQYRQANREKIKQYEKNAILRRLKDRLESKPSPKVK